MTSKKGKKGGDKGKGNKKNKQKKDDPKSKKKQPTSEDSKKQEKKTNNDKKNPTSFKKRSGQNLTTDGFSEEEKNFFLQHFENDPDLKNSPDQNSEEFTMRNDIINFFSKVLTKDKKLQKRLDKHRTVTFTNLQADLGLNSKRRGLKIDGSEGQERDSRVEFFNMVESKNKLGSVKRSERNSIANKFLYDEKNQNVNNSSDSKTTVTYVGSSNSSNKEGKTAKKVKHVRKSNSKGFSIRFTGFDTLRIDRILSGKFFERKFENKSIKGIKNDLKKYKKQLEEDARTVDKKIENISKKIEKNHKELKDGIKVYHSNGLLSLMHYFRKLNVNKHLLLQCKRTVELKTKKLLKQRITLIALSLSEKKLPFFVQESFFASTNKLVMSSRPLIVELNKIKKLNILIPQMERIYQIERKIKAKARSKKETKKALQDLVSHAKNSYDEKLMESFEECIFQDEIQDQFNKIVRDIRTTQGESIYNFLNAIENFGGLKSGRIPPFEITQYINEFVDLLKKLYKFDKKDKKKIKILRQLSDRLFYSLIGPELLEIEYKQQTPEVIENFVMKQTRLRDLDDDQLGMDEKFIDHEGGPNYLPYLKAIKVLSNMEYCITPNDMIWAVHCCYKMVISEASETCKKNKKKWSFGADELLPIIIYVLVHSDVPYITSLLSYISKFGTEKNSEIEYALTCFEGATIYIQNFDLEKLKEIEEKNAKRRKKKKKKKLFGGNEKQKNVIKKLLNFFKK